MSHTPGRGREALLNKILLLPCAACAAALLLTLRRPDLYFGSWGMAALYGGLPALGLAAFVWARRWSFEAKAKLLLGAASCLAGLFLMETVLALRHRAWRPEEAVNEPSPLQELRRRRAAGEAVWPRFGAAEAIVGGLPLIPVAGLSRRRILHCNETGEFLLYDSDEHGFNNPLGAHGKPAALVLIGDSFVEGACVVRGDNMASRLGGLNLGVGGAGPLSQLAALEEYAAPHKPKTVLWFYYANDVEDLAEESGHSALRSYLEAGYSQRLRFRQNEVDRVWEKRAARLLRDAG